MKRTKNYGTPVEKEYNKMGERLKGWLGSKNPRKANRERKKKLKKTQIG